MDKYILMLILIGMYSNPFAGSSERNEIIDLVRSERDIYIVYTKISNTEGTEKNLSVMDSLWKSDFSEFSDVQRTNSDKYLIRLALASVLVQAVRQCRYKTVGIDEFHNFFLLKTKSDNPSIKSDSMRLLGLAGFDSDIPYLEKIIKTEQEGYAEEAALSIMFIHSKAGLNALEKLSNSVSRPALKEFILEIVVKYKAYPLIDDSKDCYSTKP